MKKITYQQFAVPGPMAEYAALCGTKAFLTNTGCSIIVSANEDGRWHISIAHPDRYPTWDEIKDARYQFVPDEIHMVMPLPPERFYLNVHRNAFHLWELQEIALRAIIEKG